MTKANISGKRKKKEKTVFIVDDDEGMRESLEFLCQSVGLPVVSFVSAESFLQFYYPDVRGCLVLDVRMPGMSGLELQERLQSRRISIPVIIMTAFGDVPMAVRAMRAGAYDFIEKPFNDQVLLDRLKQAMEEQDELQLNEHQAHVIAPRLESLTAREREVMELVVAGMLNKEVGHILQISIKTVEVHRGRVMEKMRASSLADLVRMGIVVGID
jgi:RNA polymerase sigma factor (sigma-70 family)